MQEKKRKQAETERKRAEVRARLEEASKAKKAKKGFMTPDRKKKLRVSPGTTALLASFFSNFGEFSKSLSGCPLEKRRTRRETLSLYIRSFVKKKKKR